MVWMTRNDGDSGRVFVLFMLVLLVNTVTFKGVNAHASSTNNEINEEVNSNSISVENFVNTEELYTGINTADNFVKINHVVTSSLRSKGTDVNNNTQPNSIGKDSCSSASTCENCTALSKWYGGCHWCSTDQSCHAYGSYYGCAFGSTCDVKPDPPLPPGEDKSCYGQKTCRDCALLSSTCHWCSHDNACHVIGSISGCVTGVDCYNNDRCQRKQPEPLPESDNYINVPQGAASIPLFVLFAITGLVLCCATICCCVATGVRGAYNELADIALMSNMDDNYMMNDTSSISTPLISNTSMSEAVTTSSLNNNNNIVQASVPKEDGTHTELAQPLIESAVDATEEDPLLSEAPVIVTTTTTTTSVRTSRVTNTNDSNTHHNRRRRGNAPKSMNRLYSACVFCYLIVVLVAVTISLAAVRYYPQAPVYSICNDNLAWKSLIDSLTSMKVTADFEILASISNPNYMDVALDMGKGSFSHNGAFVGTYDIPPTVVAANAITDILIVAHLMPDKWDALSLTAEYYRGILVLQVDASVTVRVPVLLNYTFTVDTKVSVNVNEQSDRSLCSCPTWNDPVPNRTKTTTATTFLALPDFLTEQSSE